MASIHLSLGFELNPRSEPVMAGRVKPDAIEFEVSRVRMPELAWRQFHFAHFDVSELSVSSLMMAISYGKDTFVALPIFTTRYFWHTRVIVRDGAGIDAPGDLRGKRVGVPEYQQTAALWSRAVLEHEFGVEPTSIHWYMERTPERSHAGAVGFKPPADLDLHHIPEATNMGEMILAGELDACLLYSSTGGAGRTDRSSANLDGVARPLFADPRAEAVRYYRKTGFYPINHCVAIRRSLLDEHPWAALNIYNCFVEAKRQWMESVAASTEPFLWTGALQGDTSAFDPMPYGVAANRDLLQAMTDFSFEQGLTSRHLALEDIFVPETCEL